MFPHRAIVPTALGFALLAGCSRSAPQRAAGSPATTSGGGASTSIGNACDRKLVTSDEAANILGAPITETKAVAGDPQSCEFGTASLATLTVILRPGLGTVTVQTWLDGKMPVSATPLPGVGERAAWVPDLHEVVATKNNLLCDILPGGAVATNELQQKKIGALCNKIFAAAP